MSIAQMNDALRRAERFDIDKAPFGFPSYPYVWKSNKDSIRLEMGLTDGLERRRVIAMFMFQVNGPPTGVGVLVHVAVWLAADPGADPQAQGWTAVHSRNTNWHMAAINHFKGALLNVPGGAYVVSVPGELPPPLSPPPDDEPMPPDMTL